MVHIRYANRGVLFLPSCSLIFTRSDPPTMPTVTCCAESSPNVSTTNVHVCRRAREGSADQHRRRRMHTFRSSCKKSRVV